MVGHLRTPGRAGPVCSGSAPRLWCGPAGSGIGPAAGSSSRT